MPEAPFDRTAGDVGNILELEHVNVTVPDQRAAERFYVEGLGLTRDPHMDFGGANIWINAGSQQFHLPTASAPQRLRGTVGLVAPSLDRVRRGLDGIGADCEPGPDGTLLVRCPWGNRIRVHQAGQAFGAMALGIPYVELDVAAGTVPGIARFYESVLEAPAAVRQTPDGAVVRVGIGPHQALVFREGADPPPYDGHHMAVYVAQFSRPHARLAAAGLITAETSEHEYRFCAVVDPDTGEVLTEIEHEVRSLRHPLRVSTPSGVSTSSGVSTPLRVF